MPTRDLEDSSPTYKGAKTHRVSIATTPHQGLLSSATDCENRRSSIQHLLLIMFSKKSDPVNYALGLSSPIPLPPTLGGTYVWFCCSCNEGPMIWELYPACLWCNRPRCSSCPVEVIWSDGDQGRTKRNQGTSITNVLAVGLTNLERTRAVDGQMITPDILTCVSPTTDQPHGTDSLPFHPIRDESSRGEACTEGGEYYWKCGGCGGGPWLYATTPMCLKCEHVCCIKHCTVWQT